MIRRHRGRHDHRARAFEVGRIVSLPDSGAHRGDISGAGRIAIATAHGDASAASNQGKRAHAGAADAYKVDRATIRGSKQIHVDALM
jgi:hypothetical protein